MNRPALFLWVSIKIDKKMPFRVSWPVPLSILWMCADMLVDLTAVASLFARHQKETEEGGDKGHGKSTLRTINACARCLYAMLWQELAISEPWELVSVEVPGVRLKVKVI